MNEAEYSFGLRLAQLRQNAGLSQQALADQLSVTRQAVSNWERDQTLPDFNTLCSIAQVLGTDLNAFGNDTAPVQKRRAKRGLLAGAVLLCLCGVSFLGAYLTKREVIPDQKESAQTAILAPHEIRYTMPNGNSVIIAADGWQELTDLLAALPDTEPGPVEMTAELEDAFCYFAADYDMQFAPNYADGSFSSWDQVLFWLYKAGISGGGIMTEEQVDAAVADLFGSGVSYEHQSTEHFSITEKGYYPFDVTSYGETYTLVSLNKLDDGAYEAVLREGSGPAITFTLARDGGTFQFQSIMRSDAEEKTA